MPLDYQIFLYAKDFGIPHWEVEKNITAEQWNIWKEWNRVNHEVKDGGSKT